MEELTQTPSDEAIEWLQSIFRERISSQLMLRCVKNDSLSNSKQWHLTVEGSDKLIRIPINLAFFQPLSAGVFSDLSFESLTLDIASLNIKRKLMPAPGKKAANKPLFSFMNNGKGCDFGYDVAGLCYWVLTRSEEYSTEHHQLDYHGRFPANASHAFKHNYLNRPIVDEWIALLCKIVEAIWPTLSIIKPNFKIEVSHDIDHVSKYHFTSHKQFLTTLMRDTLKEKSFQQALTGIRIRFGSPKTLSSKDPYSCFEWLMKKSEDNNLKSTFFFMTRRLNNKYDGRYAITDPMIRKLLKKIHSRGHIIGLHPSYYTSDSPKLLRDEAVELKKACAEEKIYQKAWEGRMHFLRWNWPSTLYGWKLSDFDYDSTLGYADTPGFRCGTCHEYPMFDPIAQEALNLRQKPLVLMECSVIARRYLNLGYTQEAYDVIDRLKQRCRDVSGTFQFLWHNSHLNTQDDKDLYSFCLESL